MRTKTIKHNERIKMFRYKYVAVNDLTKIQIKAFRTKFFAVQWMKRPIKMLNAKFDKQAMFIMLHLLTERESKS